MPGQAEVGQDQREVALDQPLQGGRPVVGHLDPAVGRASSCESCWQISSLSSTTRMRRSMAPSSKVEVGGERSGVETGVASNGRAVRIRSDRSRRLAPSGVSQQ